MHNLILCEFQKFKRRPLFLLATLAAFVFPALTALMYWNTPGGKITTTCFQALSMFHLTDLGMKVAVGFNIGTILPIPLINRWIYQFYDPGKGSASEFYETMRPYFVSTPVCLGILAVMAAVFTALMIRIYNWREL